MEILGIKTPIIKPEDDLVEVILESLDENRKLKDEDIIVIASSVVSTVDGRIRETENYEASERAERLARESDIEPKIAEIIIQEADRVLSPGQGCVLTMKDRMLKVNAGIDRTNAPEGEVLLLPKNPKERAEEIQRKLEEKTGRELGVVLSDSHVNPLRGGTIGQVIGSSGVNEVISCKKERDLYGNELKLTLRGIGDQLATAAQLLMGETDERIPAVLIRGAVEAFSEENGTSQKIPPEECVYSKICDYEREYF